MQQFPKLPDHWQWRKLRHVADLIVSNVDKHAHDDEEVVRLCNYVDVYRNEFITASLPFMHATATFNEIEHFRLQLDDVIITKDSELWTDIGEPALVRYAAEDLICGYHLAILRPRHSHLSGEYLLRCLQVPYVAVQLHVVANGITRYGLSQTAIKDCQIPLPPLAEQEAIVRFIRYLDHRVNRLIRTKRQQIELLKEQKQVIIQHAVTRGLDPAVPLKPSRIDWAGCVPIHWEVRRVKHISKILRGRFSYRPRNDPALYDGAYPFIQTGDVARAGKVIHSYRQTLNEQGLAVSKMFPAGTLVMTIAANIGDVAVLDFEACFPDSIVGFVPDKSVERDFLYYAFVAMKDELLREAPVNTQGNLNVDRVGSQALSLPPKAEQTAIVSYIEQSTSNLERTIATTRSEIDLIREYRTRLVSDVVTGQLDVRHFDLPDVDDEPVSLAGAGDELDELADEELAEAAV